MKIRLQRIIRIATSTIAYHGTASDVLDLILKEGLVPEKTAKYHRGKGGGIRSEFIPGIYFSNDIESAMSYAERAAYESSSNPVLVVAKMDTKDMEADEDFPGFDPKNLSKEDLQNESLYFFWRFPATIRYSGENQILAVVEFSDFPIIHYNKIGDKLESIIKEAKFARS